MAAPTTAPPPPLAPPAPAAGPRQGVALLFAGALAYQAFHQVEHTIEAVQLNILGHAESRTLLAGLDFEWVHLAFNGFLLWCLVAVYLGAGPAVRARWRRGARAGWLGLCAALAVQGYHVVEHLVRIVQYIASGGEYPPGTVTVVLDPVWFHFGINLAVLVAMATAFFGLGLHRTVVAHDGRRTG